MRVKFITSAVHKKDYPLDRRPEVAIVGRSNAGKSSLINKLAGREVAKVSQNPGKTVTLNFFLCNEDFYLVDMPGYGYAKRSPKEKETWKEMIEGYLANRILVQVWTSGGRPMPSPRSNPRRLLVQWCHCSLKTLKRTEIVRLGTRVAELSKT